MTLPYAEYRTSDVPWVKQIPARWATVPLFSVLHESKVKNRGLAETNLLSLSYGRLIRRDIDATGGLLPESFETYQIVERDHLVFRFTDLQNDQRSLRSARAAERGIITSAYLSARPTKVDARYAAYLMRSYDTAKVFYGLGGGVRQSLKFSDIARLPVLLPSAAEQRAIADYLDRETDRIDTLIAEQHRLVEMLRDRRKSAIAAAIYSAVPVTNGKRLKHLILGVQQGRSPQCYPWPADGIATWAVLKAGAANGGIFRPEENKELPETETPHVEAAVRRGQLVVSRANTRELVGSAAVVEGEYPRLLLCDKLYAFTLDAERACARYVAAALGTPRWRGLIELEASGSSSSMQNISQRDILNLPMDLPALDTQRGIMARLDAESEKIGTLLAETERFIELSRERRAALITAAVTGQIDVRNEVA